MDPQNEKLHVGCCYLALGDYKLAHKTLLDSLTSTHQYRSDLWGYLGDVCNKLRRWQEANMAYLCALIIDPQKVDFFRLKNPQLVESYRELLKDYSETDVRALLFTHCWLENILSIPIGNTRLARFSLELENKFKEELPRDSADRYHRFAVYLCIDQSQLHGVVNIQAREQMVELAPELFKRYMTKLT
jgi:tetratricopeptide (TPR) repeat protein